MEQPSSNWSLPSDQTRHLQPNQEGNAHLRCARGDHPRFTSTGLGVASEVVTVTVRIRCFGSSSSWRSTSSATSWNFFCVTKTSRKPIGGEADMVFCMALDFSTHAARSAASHHMQRSFCGGGALRLRGAKPLQGRQSVRSVVPSPQTRGCRLEM